METQNKIHPAKSLKKLKAKRKRIAKKLDRLEAKHGKAIEKIEDLTEDLFELNRKIFQIQRAA